MFKRPIYTSLGKKYVRENGDAEFNSCHLGSIHYLTMPSCWEMVAWMEPVRIMSTISRSAREGDSKPTLKLIKETVYVNFTKFHRILCWNNRALI